MKHLISQLAHVEIFTPKPDATLWFLKDLMGFSESGRERQSVYLRGWGEFFHHSLKVTEAPQAGLGHVGWRTENEETLQLVAQEIEKTGLGQGWFDGDQGHGKAYRFTDPDGHPMEVFWDVERFTPSPEQHTRLQTRPQKYTGQGAAARRLDHINLMASHVAPNRVFLQETLGFKYNESLRVDGPEYEVGAWLSVTNLAHDIALTSDPTGSKGRLHHVALWQDTREEVMRTADIMQDAGIFIEGGPGRHGMTESFYLYVYEPGGNRFEIYSGGYLNFEPDREPLIWHTSQIDYALSWWGKSLPLEASSYGTPPVPVVAPVGS